MQNKLSNNKLTNPRAVAFSYKFDVNTMFDKNVHDIAFKKGQICTDGMFQ